MSNAFTDLLAEKGTLLADGATGTNLFNMGLMSGDAPEMWNTDEPKKITKLYRFAVDSGSDLFLTNSFGANASRLKLHGAEKRVHELSRVAAELAREVADTAERKVIVAGSVGPTGEIMEPVGTLSHSLAVEMFHETADGLKAGGADIGWLETISAPEEYRAAAEGFALAGLPWCGTMSFDTAGRTMMGLTSEGMVDMVHGLDNTPMAYGANCGTGASDLLRTVLGFAAKNGTLPIISLTHTPQEGWNCVGKRACDLIASLAGLVVLSPLMLLIAAVVKCTSRGPVLYVQTRASLGGKPFGMIKFRTMVPEAEADTGAVMATRDDPRVTRIGRLLRRISLDELPQLLNVLAGQMSLVGPRPERPELIETFRKEVPRYALREQVKPGITGWAQVNGLRGNTSIHRRIRYDVYYINNWSFAFDVRILLLTLLRGFLNPNAY